nr:MAG TPA: hypothetical protein [Caudoviricetes sp.]DAH76303.1 MAG TPA: hypothetical protein [Caudoviricetes sp.]
MIHRLSCSFKGALGSKALGLDFVVLFTDAI